ncbi:Uncharacterised protein [uncultured archaeon]|nr:Uncharacterised protein [uncultured archaeon]
MRDSQQENPPPKRIEIPTLFDLPEIILDPLLTEERLFRALSGIMRSRRYDRLFYPGAGLNFNALAYNAREYVFADRADLSGEYPAILKQMQDSGLRVYGEESGNNSGDKVIRVVFSKHGETEKRTLTYHYQVDAIDVIPENFDLVINQQFGIIRGGHESHRLPNEWRTRLMTSVPAGGTIVSDEGLMFPRLFGLRGDGLNPDLFTRFRYKKTEEVSQEEISRAFELEDAVFTLGREVRLLRIREKLERSDNIRRIGRSIWQRIIPFRRGLDIGDDFMGAAPDAEADSRQQTPVEESTEKVQEEASRIRSIIEGFDEEGRIYVHSRIRRKRALRQVLNSE